MSEARLRLVSILLLSCIGVSCVRLVDYFYYVRVWEDVNANGQQDSDEKPMAGVVIQVINHSDGTLRELCTTDAEGVAFDRDGPKCGELDFQVTVPDGYAPTTPVVVNGCGALFGLRPK